MISQKAQKISDRLNECHRIIKRDSLYWFASVALVIGYMIYQIHSIGV